MHLSVDTFLGQDVQFRKMSLPRSDSYDGSVEHIRESATPDGPLKFSSPSTNW